FGVTQPAAPRARGPATANWPPGLNCGSLSQAAAPARATSKRLLAKASQRLGQRPPQSVHLIDQVQDDVEPLVVDAHIVLEIVDETRAGEVHFGEPLLVGCVRRADPGLADPDFQGGPIDIRPFKKLPLVDHGPNISLRGS